MDLKRKKTQRYRVAVLLTLKTFRFQKLISLVISAQTHDEDTAACMDQLRLFGLTVDNLLATDDSTISKLISKATYKDNKARLEAQKNEFI